MDVVVDVTDSPRVAVVTSTDSHSPSGRPHWLLRRADQAAIGVVVLAALAAMVGYWFLRGGASGGLIDVERAGPLDARFQVDVNRADAAEFAALPGIGEKLAGDIVAWRAAHGPFRRHDDLAQVRGIGRKKLERMKPYLLPIADGPAPKTGEVAAGSG
jgi:competence protein ComEA